MTKFTIELDDELARRVEEHAAQQNLAPELWLRTHLAQTVNQENSAEADLENAADYVLKKNAELYQRLA